MSIESAIFARLSTFAGLAALVGSRIYPLLIPQDAALPALTYQRIAAPREAYTMGTGKGMPRSRWQITVWAATTAAATGYATAQAIAAQILLAMERWQDASNGVQDTEIVSDVDLFDPETLECGRAVDVSIAEVFP